MYSVETELVTLITVVELEWHGLLEIGECGAKEAIPTHAGLRYSDPRRRFMFFDFQTADHQTHAAGRLFFFDFSLRCHHAHAAVYNLFFSVRKAAVRPHY